MQIKYYCSIFVSYTNNYYYSLKPIFMNLKQVLAAGCMALALLCGHAVAYAAPSDMGGGSST